MKAHESPYYLEVAKLSVGVPQTERKKILADLSLQIDQLWGENPEGLLGTPAEYLTRELRARGLQDQDLNSSKKQKSQWLFRFLILTLLLLTWGSFRVYTKVRSFFPLMETDEHSLKLFGGRIAIDSHGETIVLGGSRLQRDERAGLASGTIELPPTPSEFHLEWEEGRFRILGDESATQASFECTNSHEVPLPKVSHSNFNSHKTTTLRWSGGPEFSCEVRIPTVSSLVTTGQKGELALENVYSPIRASLTRGRLSLLVRPPHRYQIQAKISRGTLHLPPQLAVPVDPGASILVELHVEEGEIQVHSK